MPKEEHEFPGPAVHLQLGMHTQRALKFDLCSQYFCGVWLSQQASQNGLQWVDVEAREKKAMIVPSDTVGERNSE